MFANTSQIQILNEALGYTQSGQTNKKGEQMLSELRELPQYPALLFEYYQNEGYHIQLRLLAAVQFQHWFKEYKNADDYLVQQYSEIITAIKQSIIKSYICAATNIGKQIEQAILYLASKEFPHRWNNLTQEMMGYVDTNLQNNEQTLKILKLLDKITDRYSYTMRSDELFTEIIIVCNDCHDYLYQLTEIDPQIIGGHDITLFKAKGECLKAVLLYATRYREEFQDLIEHFAEEIWNMCTLTDQDSKFDKIVINALRYFKNLVLWQDLSHFFKQNMTQLMNSLIIPNLGVTPTEKMQFEDEPTSFLESFFQFSDINTRKSVTVDLLKNIAKGFQTELVEQIQVYLTQYKNQLDSTGNYDVLNEIILLNLIIDGSTVAYRDKEGVTEISLPAELITFVYENIIKTTLGKMFGALNQNQNLLVEQQFNTLHVCYYLRFFYYFRNFINRNEILELTRIASYFLRTQSESLFGLTAITIEGLLNLKEGDLRSYVNVKNYFNKDNISPQIDEIILNLCNCSKSQEIIDSNILKTQQFIINMMKEKSLERLDIFVNLLTDQFSKLLTTGYDFQKASTLFECVGNLVNLSSQNNQQYAAKIEQSVAPFFNKIINDNTKNDKKSDNTADLISFVFQTYSILVRNSTDISKDSYKIIFESLINPSNWTIDNISIFPAYIIYISSYIYRVPSIIMTFQSQLQQILQQSLKLKQEQQFFDFAKVFITQFKLDEMRQSGWLQFLINTCIQYYTEVNMENNQQANKPRGSRPLFVKNFIVFISHLINQYTGQQILNDFNSIQPNMLTSILSEELNLIKTISDFNEKKIIFVALIDLLFNNTSSINQQAFGDILNAVVENMGTRRFRPARYTEQRENLQSMGGSGFQRLSCLREKNTLIPDIQNLDNFFGQQFNTFYNNPDVKSQLNMSQILNTENQKTLSKIILSGQSH